MKKNKVFKKVAKIVNSILFTILLLDIVLIITFEYTDRNSQSNAIKDTICYNDVFYTNNNVNKETLDSLGHFTQNLPLSLRNIIYNNKWAFLLLDEMPRELATNIRVKEREVDFSNVAGITTRINRTVYIDANYNPDNIYNTVVHETGHIMDCEYGYISNSKEFYKLYKKYKNKICNNEYYNAHQSEFFAFAFSEYYLNPGKLNNEAPEIFEYFSKQFSKNISSYNIFQKAITRPTHLIRFYLPGII